ncbi:MAG: class III extradiol dioxygenase subunit B-like domain-containing protein [Patescibacteria group bacterium]
MSLVFAAIVPHSPSTLPGMNGDQAGLTNTRTALKELEGEFYVMQPDTIFVLSPHAPMSEASFAVNLSPDFICTYEDFGDAQTSIKLHGDIELVSKIREYADAHRQPVHSITQPELDYGAAVALYHLTQHLPSVKIVPVSLAHLGVEQHYAFGQLLRSVALQSNKRIACIASVELGHAMTDPAGKAFADRIMKTIQSGDLTQLQSLNLDLAESAQAVNEFRTLVLLSGALSEAKVRANILSYEVVHDSGLLVAQFNLI